MKEALYYTSESNKELKCFLCPKECIIQNGKTGSCRVRQNIDGKLYSAIYEKFTTVDFDPIEKKPLYHFYPGTKIFSLGTAGCNLSCQYCQNWETSQKSFNEVQTRKVTTEDVIRIRNAYNSIAVAYTYNEPLINYEFILETASEAHKYGLKNVLVTNGFISEEALYNLLPYIDAMNVDVKSFRDDFYKKICNGRIAPVLRTVEIAIKKKCHVEITNLLIPKLNDSAEEIEDLTDWVYSLGEQVPLHFSRYFPSHKMTIDATPLKTIHKARQIALEKLKYIYIGNVWEEKVNNTYCPSCKELLITRKGYVTIIKSLEKGHCKGCGNKVNVVQ